MSRADQMVIESEKNVLRERALRAEAEVRSLRSAVGELLEFVDLSNRWCTECGARLVCPHRNEDW